MKEFLRRNLPPQAYRRARYLWWLARFYWPRRASALFNSRAPGVRAFPEGKKSELISQLLSVNAAAYTRMCRVMTKHGSDKGQGWHRYTAAYAALFGPLRDRPLRVLELGLGTNNPDLVSSMGVTGIPGASLRGWKELFPRALVYGADIDRTILFEEDRIKTFYCDQLDPAAIRQLWSQPDLSGGMDIIIDDGLHTLEGNLSFLEGSLEQLRPGGTYVVEDIDGREKKAWHDQLEAYSKRFPDHDFAWVELPTALNPWDNNLVIIRRNGSG